MTEKTYLPSPPDEITLDLAVLQADIEATKKLRRQIEDYLRKYCDYGQLVKLAEMLHIKY